MKMKIYKPSHYLYSQKAESERVNLGFDPKDMRMIDREELKEDRSKLS